MKKLSEIKKIIEDINRIEEWSKKNYKSEVKSIQFIKDNFNTLLLLEIKNINEKKEKLSKDCKKTIFFDGAYVECGWVEKCDSCIAYEKDKETHQHCKRNKKPQKPKCDGSIWSGDKFMYCGTIILCVNCKDKFDISREENE